MKKESKKYLSIMKPSFYGLVLSVILLLNLSVAVPSEIMSSPFVFAQPQLPPEEEQPEEEQPEEEQGQIPSEEEQPAEQPPTPFPTPFEYDHCNDGLDNDLDGLIDGEDRVDCPPLAVEQQSPGLPGLPPPEPPAVEQQSPGLPGLPPPEPPGPK